MRLTRFFSLIIFLLLVKSAGAYQDLSLGVMGGYAGNLFADSFNIGNSYLVNNVSISSVHYRFAKIKLYYDFYYTNYDTDNPINNIFHIPGIALYQKNRNSRFKWGINALLSIKDYINTEASFDSRRFYGITDCSYYVRPGLQIKAQYKFNRTQYPTYASLDIIEHWLESELVVTLPTKSTIRGTLRYGVRRFDEDDITFHWLDTEAAISQSLGQKTGLSLLFSRRWSQGGTRPLATYNIISGITSYWDPWKGNQVDLSMKRILPLSIVTRLDAGYWSRQFNYDPVIRNQFWWLRYSSGRRDYGWITKADFNRQFNSVFLLKRELRIGIVLGYTSNESDDSYYDYKGLFAQSRLEIQLF